jgi:hypothetical protein
MRGVGSWRASFIALPQVLLLRSQSLVISEPILRHLLAISQSLLKFDAAQHLLLWTKYLEKLVYRTQKPLPFLVRTFH